MDNELNLKLQAYVDGELKGADAEAVRSQIESDPNVAEAYRGLTSLKSLVET